MIMPFRIHRLFLCIVLGTFTVGCSGSSGGGPQAAPESLLTDESLSDVRTASPKSPYADAIVECVRVIRASDSCTLKKLPLIAQEFPNPTIDDIMTRVVVSHEWMAERFRALLAELPDDIPTLLKATTAIVIDADIRPSHYNTRTGALYLDPAMLWLSNEEKSTINPAKDYRSGYGDGFKFQDVWRYVKDNAKAYKKLPLDGDGTRELKDILYLVAAVLYHEASHANDSFPVTQQASLNPDVTVYQASIANSESIARMLGKKYPLKSDFIFDMAQILMVGLLPGDSQKETTAEVMGAELELDGANDIYNYVSPTTSLAMAVLHEDVAMLFEETMMKHHFNIDRDVGFLQDNPDGEKCDDFILKWGVRNRIADPRVIERAKFVASMVNPGKDLSGFFKTLGAPKGLPLNLGWCSTIDTGGSAAATKSVGSAHYTAPGAQDPLESQLRPAL